MTPAHPVTAVASADRVAVLMYHRIGPIDGAAEAKYAVTPHLFAAQMRALAAAGFHAIRIEDLVAWLEGGPAPAAGGFVITFDDGYLGVQEHAWPVLKQLGWPFTVFLVTDLLGDHDRWSRFDALDVARYPLLGADHVLDMQRAGVAFHSHSRSHASLTQLDDAQLADELSESRASLSRLLGPAAADFLAYPYGHHDPRVESAARLAGYRAAFSVKPGFNRRDTPRFQLRRLDVFGTDTPRQLVRKLRYGSNDGSWRKTLAYYQRQVLDSLQRMAA